MENIKDIYYSIQEASERLDLSYRSLHYWEDKLEINISRDNAGNRIYSEDDIELLEKIKELKTRGMLMDGIKALLREKGILPEPIPKNVIVVDERALELKTYILDEIRGIFAQEIHQTNNNLNIAIEKLDKVINENQELKDELLLARKLNEQHYEKIDSKITEWRNKKPWYRKLVNKK